MSAWSIIVKVYKSQEVGPRLGVAVRLLKKNADFADFHEFEQHYQR
jgi:hypothetical protein